MVAESSQGNWFSPREAAGMQHDKPLIAEDFRESRRRRQRANAKHPGTQLQPSALTPLSAQVETRAQYTVKRAVRSRGNGSWE